MLTYAMTDSMPSLVASSIVSALDCQEMVCADFSEYADKAIRLANGGCRDEEQLRKYETLPDRLKQLHGSIELKLLRHKVEENRLTKPLFDTLTWIRNYESGLLSAYQMKSRG